MTLIPVRQSGRRQVRPNPDSVPTGRNAGNDEEDSVGYAFGNRAVGVNWNSSFDRSSKYLIVGRVIQLHQRDVVGFAIGIGFDLLVNGCEAEFRVVLR